MLQDDKEYTAFCDNKHRVWLWVIWEAGADLPLPTPLSAPAASSPVHVSSGHEKEASVEYFLYPVITEYYIRPVLTYSGKSLSKVQKASKDPPVNPSILLK